MVNVGKYTVRPMDPMDYGSTFLCGNTVESQVMKTTYGPMAWNKSPKKPPQEVTVAMNWQVLVNLQIPNKMVSRFIPTWQQQQQQQQQVADHLKTVFSHHQKIYINLLLTHQNLHGCFSSLQGSVDVFLWIWQVPWSVTRGSVEITRDSAMTPIKWPYK